MTLADFLVFYQREHATTRKLLHAFPADQAGFKPHERSNSAHQLGWTFVVEEMLMLKALTGEPVLGSGFPPAPATWAEVVAAFDDFARKGQARMNRGFRVLLARAQFNPWTTNISDRIRE